MKRSLFNAMQRDKTVQTVTVSLTTEQGQEMYFSPWFRGSGLDAGESPENWDDARTTLQVDLTIPEYHLLRIVRDIRADMVAARKARRP